MSVKFTIRGLIRGQEQEIAWDDGELSGDEEAVGRLKAVAEMLEGKSVGPVAGAFGNTNHLADPLRAAILMNEEVFDEILEATGDVPEPDDVPDGAIT